MHTTPHPFDLEDAVAQAASRVAALGGSRHHAPASATLWRDGLLVTTARLRWRGTRQALLLPSGDTASAELLGQDAATDLAVLKLAQPWPDPQPEAWTPVAPGSVRAGRFVFAVAREGSGLHAASFGHVGAANGAWRSWRGGSIDAYIRLDGGLHAGYAGAPVADVQGRLVGIATPNLSRHWGMVLPAATVQRVVDEIAAHGKVARGYLGVALQPAELAEGVVAALGLAGAQALLVSSVAKGGPAQQAGLLVGDAIVGIDGQDVAQLEGVQARIEAGRPGAMLSLAVVRGGQRQEVAVLLADRPQPRGGCRP
jgi:serine protease Do